jgi:hypothetical protein
MSHRCAPYFKPCCHGTVKPGKKLPFHSIWDRRNYCAYNKTLTKMADYYFIKAWLCAGKLATQPR